MSGKMKDCFTGHIIMHSLFGLGLGIVLANQIVALNRIWIGIALMAVAVVADAMRKS